MFIRCHLLFVLMYYFIYKASRTDWSAIILVICFGGIFFARAIFNSLKLKLHNETKSYFENPMCFLLLLMLLSCLRTRSIIEISHCYSHKNYRPQHPTLFLTWNFSNFIWMTWKFIMKNKWNLRCVCACVLSFNFVIWIHHIFFAIQMINFQLLNTKMTINFVIFIFFAVHCASLDWRYTTPRLSSKWKWKCKKKTTIIIDQKASNQR